MALNLDLDDTIAAIASGQGGALRGIVRLSGPQVPAIVATLFVADRQEPPATRFATCSRGQLALPGDLPPCPATLYLWPDERSYTRQPSAELHLPGSPPLLAAALAAACQAGARLAQPGEFTLRAFLAGRLDLTQAEAVLGVIDAQSPGELQTSLAQLAGGLAQPLAGLRNSLLESLAHLEAGLDFVDEDIQFITPARLAAELAIAEQEVRQLAARMAARGEAGRLPRVVLVGRANAGKSSLLNALAGEAAAIVSPVAGTTRDYVARRVPLGGVVCLLIDTAGSDTGGGDPASEGEPSPASSAIDDAAQQARHEQTQQADLVLVCLDASQPLAAQDRQQLAAPAHKPRLVVWTKCDLADKPEEQPGLPTSSQSGLGIAELGCAIAAQLRAQPAETAVVAGTAERSREALRLAGEALARAREVAGRGHGDELVAAELRTALGALGEVAGAVYTEDLLDRIFSRFCIGK